MAYSQPIAPRSERTRSRRCGQAANGQRHCLGSAHRRALARYARTEWQLELGLRAIFAHDVAPDRLLGDKGYDSDAIRDDLTKQVIDP